jgi:hypothetical protein
MKLQILVGAIAAFAVVATDVTANGGHSQLGTAPGCDGLLWDHVYSPSRLQVVNRCVAATGVIQESNVDEDGDQHLLLKLDPGQDHLLVKRNLKKKGGNLVVEIVCANPTTQKKPKKACAGYRNSVPVPAVGAHVKVTGTYVIDSHNGWAELHPVSRVEAIR